MLVIIMLNINKLLNNCNTIKDLNNFMNEHQLETKIGVMGGRRIVDGTQDKGVKCSGSVAIKDIVACFERVCKQDEAAHPDEARSIIKKILELDSKATQKLDNASMREKVLTNIKRFFGGKFDPIDFLGKTSSIESIRKYIEGYEKLSKKDQQFFRENYPESYKLFGEFLSSENINYDKFINFFGKYCEEYNTLKHDAKGASQKRKIYNQNEAIRDAISLRKQLTLLNFTDEQQDNILNLFIESCGLPLKI